MGFSKVSEKFFISPPLCQCPVFTKWSTIRNRFGLSRLKDEANINRFLILSSIFFVKKKKPLVRG